MAEEFNYQDTIYLRNLNEKVSINTLKSTLQNTFAAFGPILSIQAAKSLKMKGQAFITFENTEDALKALSSSEGLELFKKPVVASLAKGSSDSSMKRHLNEDQFKEYLEKRKLAKKAKDEVKEKEKIKSKIEANPPYRILLLQNLPSSLSQSALEDKFKACKGFVEVRYVAVRNLAFVDFEEDEQAVKVLEELKGKWSLDGVQPDVNYAKK